MIAIVLSLAFSLPVKGCDSLELLVKDKEKYDAGRQRDINAVHLEPNSKEKVKLMRELEPKVKGPLEELSREFSCDNPILNKEKEERKKRLQKQLKEIETTIFSITGKKG